MRISKYFNAFFQSSQSAGIILMICVAISLMLANSSLGPALQQLLDTAIGTEIFHLNYSISVWINDGLMAIFFLLVGLEIKRELTEGELSNIQNASLPIVAAIGGMLVPALIYFIFNQGTEYSAGWGIPMATDIAFSLAIVSMLGRKVPIAIKVFLAALAIVDDLGAILVIALFYTEEIHWLYLGYSALTLIVLGILNYFKAKKIIFYLIPGIVLWYFVHHSGIHATISGVLLALLIPVKIQGDPTSPLKKLEQQLHSPVNYFILPVFAFANTNILFKAGMVDGLISSLGTGIILGLAVGKVLGINLFSFLAIKLRIAQLPSNSSWHQMIGVGFLAGIGFTMSIFISLLSFKGNIPIQEEAKFAILVASILSGSIGYYILKKGKKEKNTTEDKKEIG